jgi:hypothetical protein
MFWPGVPAAAEETEPRFIAELEAGPVWQGRNEVQIPNDDTGTRFSLVDVQGQGPWPAGRLYLTWNINARHSLRGLAAPLSVTETGELEQQTWFAGSTFESGTPTQATYKFDSWRLTYAYRFHDGERWAWWVGFTAKVRDAKIELAQGTTTAEKTDLGFVPLLHIRGWYQFSDDWKLELDVDALAGGPGRAEDAALKLRYDLDHRWGLSVGYRTVEGGADVDEVYNFAWLHYAMASVTFDF